MKKTIYTALFALALSANVSLVFAAETPEQVESQYIDALRLKGFAAVPEYIHPDELIRFREMLLPLLLGDQPLAQTLRTSFFGPSATAESVQTLSPNEFMRGFMGLAQQQIKGMNLMVGKSDILGSVKEGEVIHLVTRNTAGAGSVQVTQLEIISLKPYRDTWRLLLSGKIEGLAQAIKSKAAELSQ